MTPVIFDGVDRSSKINKYFRNEKPKTNPARKNITKEELEEINKAIEPLIHKHYFDSHVYEAVRDHKAMFKKDGTRYAERTVLLYIFRMRKKLDVKKPDTLADIVLRMLQAGYSLDDVIKMSGVRRDYGRDLQRRAINKGLLKSIQKD